MVQIVKFKVGLFISIKIEFSNHLGIQNRCYAGLCQVGTCYEQTNGISTYAYCQCASGYQGITCNQCLY